MKKNISTLLICLSLIVITTKAEIAPGPAHIGDWFLVELTINSKPIISLSNTFLYGQENSFETRAIGCNGKYRFLDNGTIVMYESQNGKGYFANFKKCSFLMPNRNTIVLESKNGKLKNKMVFARLTWYNLCADTNSVVVLNFDDYHKNEFRNFTAHNDTDFIQATKTIFEDSMRTEIVMNKKYYKGKVKDSIAIGATVYEYTLQGFVADTNLPNILLPIKIYKNNNTDLPQCQRCKLQIADSLYHLNNAAFMEVDTQGYSQEMALSPWQNIGYPINAYKYQNQIIAPNDECSLSFDTTKKEMYFIVPNKYYTLDTLKFTMNYNYQTGAVQFIPKTKIAKTNIFYNKQLYIYLLQANNFKIRDRLIFLYHNKTFLMECGIYKSTRKRYPKIF